MFKHRLRAPNPTAADSLVLGWGPRICISDKFPGDVPLKEHLYPEALKKPQGPPALPVRPQGEAVT